MVEDWKSVRAGSLCIFSLLRGVVGIKVCGVKSWSKESRRCIGPQTLLSQEPALGSLVLFFRIFCDDLVN